MYSKSQNLATQKYQREKLEQVSIRVKKGEREKFKEIADGAGLSLAEMIRRAIREYAENHGIAYPE